MSNTLLTDKTLSPQSTTAITSPLPPVGEAVVLLSGGLDSVVALAEAVAAGGVCLALTFNYGQRAFAMEVKAAEAICAHYGVPHQVVPLPWLETLLPVALSLKKSPGIRPNLPTPNYDAATVPEGTKQVWVPNRNGVFLNIAAAFAEAYGAKKVVFGANADEAQGFPDNTQAYRERIDETFQYSTLNKINVWTPVGELTKAAIVARGIALGVPLEKVWSCYESGPIHCGVCASCQLLKSALAQSPQPVTVRFSQ